LAVARVHAATVRPERIELGDDALAELIARACERKGGMRVQALERAAAAGAADAELERRAAVAAGLTRGELAAERALVGVGLGAARRERRVLLRGCSPALDAAGCLEPRDGSHEMAAGDVVRGRKRLALG